MLSDELVPLKEQWCRLLFHPGTFPLSGQALACCAWIQPLNSICFWGLLLWVVMVTVHSTVTFRDTLSGWLTQYFRGSSVNMCSAWRQLVYGSSAFLVRGNMGTWQESKKYVNSLSMHRLWGKKVWEICEKCNPALNRFLPVLCHSYLWFSAASDI